jgi:hypothetical protein
MSVSEHANYLLNEYGRLQFDYAAYCKPYGESLRNEARNNLEEYIAELEDAQRWTPVSEKLPEANTPVLTISKGNDVATPIDVALRKRIAGLEAAQARWVMASERLPKVSGWYLTGLVYFLGSPYSGEVYFDAENIEPRWNNITSDKIYCWLEGVPELPQPPEVQE